MRVLPPDYAVVIVLAVFMISAASWILSARKWFNGPVPNISAEEATKTAGGLVQNDSESPAQDEKSRESVNGSSLDKQPESKQ